jgi:hypothetical protein
MLPHSCTVLYGQQQEERKMFTQPKYRKERGVNFLRFKF